MIRRATILSASFVFLYLSACSDDSGGVVEDEDAHIEDLSVDLAIDLAIDLAPIDAGGGDREQDGSDGDDGREDAEADAVDEGDRDCADCDAIVLRPCPDDDPDSDGDGICDSDDACEGEDDLRDADGDRVPDGCDDCPLDPDNDADDDGVCGDVDLCAGGDDALDEDEDTTPDDCDVCPGADDSRDADDDDIPDDCDCDASSVCDENALCVEVEEGVECSCPDGYTGDGLVCDPVRCPNLDPIPHGAVIAPGGNTYGQTAFYTCNPGYMVVGDASRVCQVTGVWSGEEPECVGRYCGPLDPPDNGWVTTSGGDTTVGSIAT